jgi:hypothetical protein
MAKVSLRNGIAAGLACAGIGLALHGGDARALVVEVDGSHYNMTTVTGSYVDLQTTLSAQPWFGNADLSLEFATIVNNGLGMPGGSGNRGPIFAYGIDPYDGDDLVGGSFLEILTPLSPVFMTARISTPNDPQTFALAQLQPPAPTSSVPAPLPLIGAMTGFGVSRRLRVRIQAASPKRMGC